MKKGNVFATIGIAMALSGIASYAVAAGMDDPRRADYFKTFDGKTIAFVPSTMGIDLTEGWASALKQQADRLGMKLEIRDPHLSADVGAQAITALITEKPDVIIAHNLDVQSYAKLLKRAEDAGIHVIQVSMRSNYNSDAYVGADWIAVGEAETQAIVDRCGAGTSGKVAILVGQPTAGSDSGMLKGAENVLAKHPEIKLVANQAADWDANKARNVIATVIQQNPDLCGVVGFWDVMDLGAAADRAGHLRRRRADGVRQCREGRVPGRDRLPRHGHRPRLERRDPGDPRVRAAGRQGEDRHLQPDHQDHEGNAPPGSVLEREEPGEVTPPVAHESAEPQETSQRFSSCIGKTSR
jgi:ABC-type sugar transport system substrate-binding protein